MGNGQWILSAVIVGSVFIILLIYEIVKNPKNILRKILSSALAFIIVFSGLVFVSHVDPTFVESQMDYIQGNQ